MWWTVFVKEFSKLWPEFFRFLNVAGKEFRSVTKVAVVLVLVLFVIIGVLAYEVSDKKSENNITINRYERIISIKDSVHARKDSINEQKLENCNSKLLTAYADAENTFVDRYLSNYEKLERTFIGREKTQKSQINKIENLTKQNEKYINKIENINNKNSEK